MSVIYLGHGTSCHYCALCSDCKLLLIPQATLEHCSVLLTQVVHVDTANSEDRWAVRLLNVLTHLHQLLLEGKTREMFIWGYVKVESRPCPCGCSHVSVQVSARQACNCLLPQCPNPATKLMVFLSQK